MALRIKELRKMRGMTQTRLAELAGIDRTQLSKIETEREPANTRRLASIARALSVDVSDLFSSFDASGEASAIIQIFETLPPESRQAVLAHARALAAVKSDKEQ